jgi:hypothetical protein
MQVKILEVRDDGTFIPVVAVLMMPEHPMYMQKDTYDQQRYLLRRAGYTTDDPDVHQPLVVIFNANGGYAPYDPHHWTNRTMHTAHLYITEHFGDLKDGDVIDVEWILGEKPTAKVSERVTVGGN